MPAFFEHPLSQHAVHLSIVSCVSRSWQIGGQRLLAFACAPASSAPAAVELVATLCSAPANLHALLRRLSRSCLLASKRNGEEERSVLKRVSSVLAAVVSRSDVVTALVGAPVGIGGAVGAARGDGVAQAQLRTLVAAIDAHHTREGVGAFCMEPRLAVEIRRRHASRTVATSAYRSEGLVRIADSALDASQLPNDLIVTMRAHTFAVHALCLSSPDHFGAAARTPERATGQR
eukprot:3871777-Pleurochrysis_carterae.AAC.1